MARPRISRQELRELLADDTELHADPDKGYYPNINQSKVAMIRALRDVKWFRAHKAHRQALSALAAAKRHEREWRKSLQRFHPVIRQVVVRKVKEMCR